MEWKYLKERNPCREMSLQPLGGPLALHVRRIWFRLTVVNHIADAEIVMLIEECKSSFENRGDCKGAVERGVHGVTFCTLLYLLTNSSLISPLESCMLNVDPLIRRTLELDHLSNTTGTSGSGIQGSRGESERRRDWHVGIYSTFISPYSLHQRHRKRPILSSSQLSSS
jgi:hypothetical protein